MLTKCPGCRTVFRITGAILRAAHGQVRCGNCNTQFDAIEHALDEDALNKELETQEDDDKTAYMPPRESAAFVATQPSVSSDEAGDFMAAFGDAAINNEQITMEGDRVNPPSNKEPVDPDFMIGEDNDDSIIEVFNSESEDWSEPFEAAPKPDTPITNDELFASDAPPPKPAASDEFTRVRHELFTSAQEQEQEDQDVFAHDSSEQIEFSRVVNQEALTDGDAEVDPFNEAVYMTELDNALRDPTGQPPEPDPLLEPEPESILERTRLRRWSRKARRKKNAEPLPDVLDPGQSQDLAAASRTWPVTLGCAALAVLLIFQLVHHYRQSLVRHPAFGGALKSVYSAFGSKLEPRWELSAYTIKQWGIVSDPQEPGILRVRASVTNNAVFAQPFPMLKLTLEDRFGTKIGMRAFKPVEYLPSAANASRLLEAGAAANVDLAIVDPGDEAVGFQFDSCLGSDESMRCAHE